MNNWTRLLWLLVILVFTSCDSTVIYEQNQAIDNATWKASEKVQFEFEMKDTTTLHNFYINLRNGENYPFSNIYVFVEMEFPNGKKSIDTVECYLADPTGKWIGSGTGSIYDNRFLYQHGKQFPLSGRYKVNIQQGMRVEELTGIYDVGFRVARTI